VRQKKTKKTKKGKVIKAKIELGNGIEKNIRLANGITPPPLTPTHAPLQDRVFSSKYGELWAQLQYEALQ